MTGHLTGLRKNIIRRKKEAGYDKCTNDRKVIDETYKALMSLAESKEKWIAI